MEGIKIQLFPLESLKISRNFVTMNKAVALKTIKELPANFSVDELFEKLLFIQKIEEGLNDSNAGKLYSSREARRKLKKWLK